MVLYMNENREDKQFKEAITKIKEMRIVKHITEPVILKHDKDTSSFNRMNEKEVMRIFNDVYKGNNNYTIEDVKKELVNVDVTY